MIAKIKNENYGYSVATYGDYVAVSNPDFLRWSIDSASIYHTGSVDYFRYNMNRDQHDYVGTLYRPPSDLNLILATEDNNSGSGYSNIMENNWDIEPHNWEMDLATAPRYKIDSEINEVTISDIIIEMGEAPEVENKFGTSLDMYGKLLIIGTPYYTQLFTYKNVTVASTGSSVSIYDLSRTEYFSLTQSNYAITIENPTPSISESFGQGVSINSSWIAVGSPLENSSRGIIYVYKNTSTGSNYSWEFFQAVTPSSGLFDAKFGSSVKLNKQSGSMSHSMVVGCGNRLNNEAYYFEFISGSWEQTYIFNPTTEILPLTFGGYYPYDPTMNIISGFGYSVSTFNNTVIIGAPLDRNVYEFSGSSLYQQGSVYIFEKCTNLPYTQFNLVLKTYGNQNILKNNRLGYSVDVFGGNAIAGIPKINNETITSCYIESTLEQLHHCNSDLDNLLNGQAMLLQKNTSSLEWGITNIYQKKKSYLGPYREFGDAVSIANRSMVVGAPIQLVNTNREINVNITQSGTVELDDICGKSYIYNLKNLRTEFHVGNVFYRNGKILLMTSGSSFDELFFNPVNPEVYEYDLSFKGEHTIFEKQVICNVSPGEFNVSTNPTSVYKPVAILDVNKDGTFDFQDVDIILRYMQYKNTSILGIPVSTDWSSSVVVADDEISLLKFNQSNYSDSITSQMTSASIVQWETIDTGFQDILDLNEDNRIDIRDMNIMWKYFSNRLTQANYAKYITPSCKRKIFSDIIDYMNVASQRGVAPKIKSDFLTYAQSASLDKTGSFLAPVATAIGLYSGLDLVMIGKLGNPIKITPELPINFVVRMDY